MSNSAARIASLRNTLLLLAALFCSAVFPAFNRTEVFGQAPNSPSADLALVGGTIYVSPTEEPIRDGVVLIQGGKIAAVGRRASVKIPRSTETLNCAGMTITAGFWNSHVHFFERKWADSSQIPAPELERQIQEMLTRYGFTSVFDLGSPSDNTRNIRERIESGEVPGPRIRSASVLAPPGAVPPDQVLSVLGVMRNLNAAPGVADAAQATEVTRKLLEEGTDGIKLHSLSEQRVIQAAVNEAHRAGKLVFAHPSSNGTAGLLAAVKGGVDVVAHTTPWASAWDESVLAAMKERRVAMIPTLQIWKYLRRHDRVSSQEQFVNSAVGQLRAWSAAGGTVLFGTDVGAVDSDPSEEYALMAEAGMSFRQILAALTTAPAERFGDAKQRGRIAAGFDADLVVLKGDPSKNVREFAAVRYTLRAGKIIYRAAQ